jgi:predicted transcriptional regulator
VPACVTPLLEKGWLLRKWDGKDYTFRITVTGKSELEKY